MLRKKEKGAFHQFLLYCIVYLKKLHFLNLTHFSPVSHFYTPWKRQKTKGFLATLD